MSAPILSVRDLRITRGDGHVLLHPLSFDLAAGERLAIVGESGSGKTLATRALLDLLPPGVRRDGGMMLFEGRDLGTLTAAQMRAVRGAGIGMVFQEPMTSLNPAMTIGRQLAEGLRLHRRLGAAEIRALCLDMLRRVRIRDPEGCLECYPHEFSGGMRQRIMLASVLLLKPRLLIADEPTTALDTLAQREVLELMVELTREVGTALLLITHDLGLVARYTERVLVLEKGHLVEQGPTAQVLARPAHPYTARLVGSLPRPAPVPDTPPPPQPVLLSVEGLGVDYPGRRGLIRAGAPVPVLRDVSLEVRRGEVVALVGGSGSGKTTLGRAALALRQPSAGRVCFAGADLAAMDRKAMTQFRREAQLVFQDPFSSLDPRLRVEAIVAASLRHDRSLSAAMRADRVAAMLEAVGLTGFERRFPHEMSGGQRQRVAIARAVVSQPRLVVADEPVSALDLTVQLQVLTLFQRLQREQGFACLMITHDLAVVQQVADRVIVLENGRIVEQGATAAVFADPRHAYTRAMIEATPVLGIG